MSRFQFLVNVFVVYIFIAWIAWPFFEGYLPYDDSTVPDEVLELNREIEDLLARTSADFRAQYENRAPLSTYAFVYGDGSVSLPDSENFAQNEDSVVYITTEDSAGWRYTGSGSILTPDGVILTNYHVIDDAEKIIVTTTRGVHYPVTGAIAGDEALDIAFLKIDAEGLRPMPLGDSETVAVGAKTLVIGHPENFINTLSIGNVAGIRGYGSQGAGTNIQITNPISSGNSGGAVLNEYGELIAVPSWRLEYDANIIQVQNLNFAVPIHEALRLLE